MWFDRYLEDIVSSLYRIIPLINSLHVSSTGGFMTGSLTFTFRINIIHNLAFMGKASSSLLNSRFCFSNTGHKLFSFNYDSDVCLRAILEYSL